MNGNSLDIKEDLISKLKNIVPAAFTEDNKLDTEKLNQILGDEINTENERYFLNWAGKSEVFNVLQTPTTATLAPVIDESINFENTENIFIEGENLEVLKVLQKSYYGKIKMIFIDPPYNTGNDSFIYPDKFEENKIDYLKRIEEKDEDGYLLKEGFFRKNSKENGHYHSNWLSMMYPRLFLARNLLKEDGLIFISIDDNEVHNLKLLLNEVFGEENFKGCFLWKKKSTSTNVKGANVSALCDYILSYGKSDKSKILPRIKLKETRIYPEIDEEGNYRTTVIEKKDSGGYKRDTMKFPILGKKPREGKRWQIGEDEARKKELQGRFFISEEGIVKLKIYDFEEKDTVSAQPNLLDKHGTSESASKMVNETIFGIPELFNNPKPIELINHLIKISCEKSDIVLDFFAGSGTTAHSVIDLSLEEELATKFIIIQLPEPTDEYLEAFKAGYKTISEVCRERIVKVIDNIERNKKESPQLFEGTEMDLGFKVFKLKNSNFKIWRSDTIENGDDLKNQMEVFKEPLKKEAKEINIIFELLLKLGFDLNTKIEKESDDFTFYKIDDNRILIFTDGKGDIRSSIKKSSEKYSPEKIIVMDSLFENSDEAKTNVMLQLRDAGIEFSSI